MDSPDATSFRYGREGIIFEGDNQPLPVAFEQIAKIAREGDNLHFFLRNGLNYFASLTSDDARASFPRFKGDY